MRLARIHQEYVKSNKVDLSGLSFDQMSELVHLLRLVKSYEATKIDTSFVAFLKRIRIPMKMEIRRRLKSEGLEKSAPFNPRLGLYRKPNRIRTLKGRKLRGYSNSMSHSKSGSAMITVSDPDRLKAVLVEFKCETGEALMETIVVKDEKIEVCHIPVAPTSLSALLDNPYMGDLPWFEFKEVHALVASNDVPIEVHHFPVDLKKNGNLVIKLKVDPRLAALTTADHVLAGPYRGGRGKRSIDLRGANRFEMKLGPVAFTQCYLGLFTELDDDQAWGAYATVNGSIAMFDGLVPMTGEVPIGESPNAGGILVMNSAWKELTCKTDLGDLKPLLGGVDLVKKLRVLAPLIKQYRLEHVTVITDCSQKAAIETSFTLKIGNDITFGERTIPAKIDQGWEIGVQIGFLGGLEIVTIDATGTGNALNDPNSEVEFDLEPEFCVRMWMPSTFSFQIQDKVGRAMDHLKRNGKLHKDAIWSIPEDADGLMIEYYHDKAMVYIGTDGQDAVLMWSSEGGV